MEAHDYPATDDSPPSGNGCKLFYHPGATSFAPHVVLRELERPFELCRIDINNDEQKSETFLAINPRGRVPVLYIGQQLLTETPAILLHLAGLDRSKKLLGECEAKTAEMLSWLCSSVHIAFAQNFFPDRFSTDPDHWPAIGKAGRKAIAASLLDVDGRFSGPWIMGRQFTIADPYFFVFCRFAHLIGLDPLQDAVHLRPWLERFLGRPSVIEAMAAEGITLEGRR